MRRGMPVVAAFIDSLRAAFGREVIDQAIRQGIRDGTFCARENGHVVGCAARSDRKGGEQ